MQPNLFYQPETKPFDEQAKRDAGKRVTNRLLTVRQQLQAADNLVWVPLLNDAINAVCAESLNTNEQQEQRVLNSIEKIHANTFEEIADDTRLPIKLIKQIVYHLASENVLRIITNSKRTKGELIFSKRKINQK